MDFFTYILGVPDSRPLADFLPTITIKAKDFANELTNVNIRKADLKSEPAITSEHVKNNKDVRGLLLKSGIKPENLPAEEDLKKNRKESKIDGQKTSERNKEIEKKINQRIYKHGPKCNGFLGPFS